MKIYVNFEIPETPEKFLKIFYSNKESDRAYCVETYFDKECKQIQCNANRLRSFDDLFFLFTTYYPEMTAADLISLLANSVLKSSTNKNLYLHIANCSTIDRIRIFYYEEIESCWLYFDCSKYSSKYSWKELFAMIGINSKDEYRLFLQNLKEKHEKI